VVIPHYADNVVLFIIVKEINYFPIGFFHPALFTNASFTITDWAVSVGSSFEKLRPLMMGI
jgi:hypothetical protein